MNQLNHVVLIPDGNRRWAKNNGLNTIDGYLKGSESIRCFFSVCKKYKIKVVTVWAFSTENWKRTPIEITSIMKTIELSLKKYRKKFISNNIRFFHVGRKDRLRQHYPSLLKEIEYNEKKTLHNHLSIINLAVDYGGRDEIIRAVTRILNNSPVPQHITTDLIADHLDTRGQPDPDLIIRTSGEYRLSGIFPFQSDYAELCFCSENLPDLTKARIKSIFNEFIHRERRKGGNKTTT